MLNPSLKLIAKGLVVSWGNLEHRIVWLTRMCQVAWLFLRASKDWQIDHPHTHKGRQE